jgi:hypothetical protein
MPPALAAKFTQAEMAAFRIVSDEVRHHGVCALHIDAIAARAGTCRTTVAARAQPGSVPRIGVLRVAGPTSDDLVEEMRQGLRDLGHVEGRTFVIEYRWPQDGRLERLPELAAELVRGPRERRDDPPVSAAA